MERVLGETPTRTGLSCRRDQPQRAREWRTVASTITIA